MRDRRRSEGRASPVPGEGTPMAGTGHDVPAHDTPAHDMPAGRGAPAASAAPRSGAGEPEMHALWEDRTRISLQPIAAPSILGLFGFAGATMMVGAWQANWYGSALTPLVLFPFVIMFGGLAQFLAGMWSYRARDGLATAMHGMWGAFWLGWGLLFMLVAIGVYPLALTPRIGAVSQGFAFWFIPLCVITGLGALSAMGRNLAMSAVLWPLAAGAAFTAAGFWAGSTWPLRIGGWLFVISAGIAVYTAAAMMMENTYGRTILPLFAFRKNQNIPGRRASRPLEYRYGEPGVKIGQ
ncbi:acetate uptake transporter family protein [Actinomadura opuntiae]|uniref:acetate uptake transporter family protein n=1 Tax=Actinomadura sp. OS1-43 TaxID=604315 RepID=UPI00255AA854|nr:GPR1/FUN34/YaaH family transporter [Actinomadura sp. OS1-43]MDL4817666.1 GPR1/FUN34/YaaH family transporter [Actinomadura sp. OS1-43]